MSSLTSEQVSGKTRWRLQFRVDKHPRQLRLGVIRESAAKKIQRMVDDLLDSHRLKILPDIQTREWIQVADWELIQRIEAFGITSQVSDLMAQRRRNENPDTVVDVDQRPTLLDFCQWYIRQRKSDCEKSTIRKVTASLNQLCDYCRDNESIATVDDVDPEMAFRFQLHRKKDKAEATVSKDVKIAKTAFSFGVRAGKVAANPFKGMKAGSDVNLDGQHIMPITDYDKLIDACPNSTWRAIIALARLGGLRCPSELTELKWIDVNWDAGTMRIRSPKTKRYGKAERTIPLFTRLDQELSDHWELTAGRSEYVIDIEPLRRRGTSLSTRFKAIQEAAGTPELPSPFRNMRLSAANDVCRLPGITPATVVDWFGHDMKTALKHYHRTTRQDFDQAIAVDPFRDQEIARKSVATESGGYRSGYIMPDTGEASEGIQKKSPRFAASQGMGLPLMTPTGLEPVLPP